MQPRSTMGSFDVVNDNYIKIEENVSDQMFWKPWWFSNFSFQNGKQTIIKLYTLALFKTLTKTNTTQPKLH